GAPAPPPPPPPGGAGPPPPPPPQDRGTAGTLDWLRARIRDAEDQDVPSEEQARRLESDAAAVQLLTIHRSKGLEFPVVLCPFLWAGVPRASAPYTVSRPADGGWLIDVGPASRSGADVHKQRAEAEMLGEHLRLCYVALTRARHKVVAWWLRPTSSRTAAFDRLLLSRDETGRVDTTAAPALPAKDDPDGALERLRSLAAATDIALEVVPPVVRPPARGHPATDPTTLERAHHRRWIDPRWRRTSYSALIAGVDRDAAEEARFTTDEPATPRVGPDDPTRARPLAADDGRALHSITLPMARVRGSAAFGTMVHAVLERTDLAAPVLGHELADRLAEEQRRHGLPDDRDAVHAGLLAAVHTPLGPLADDRPLAGTPWSDRLDEPRFELPIGGGDRPGHPALLHHIADLLPHHLPAADPVGG
ncbi:MAG: hypothetical protein JJT89_18130, partial [Nitriliruptoraceae bacterium]|nr:hypothetical protein [Nitriliruptoraceae bacterium]